MTRHIPASERIQKAWKLIQQARDLPIPEEGGKYNFSYIAQVKDYLRQARDLVKFIPSRPGATTEIKSEAKKVLAEADQANKEILH